MTTFWPELLDLVQRCFAALGDDTRARLLALAAEHDATPREVGHFVYLAENFDPAALSVADYCARDPFDHPEVVSDVLLGLVERGWAESAGGGTYRITIRGESLRRRRWAILDAGLHRADLLPAETVTTLLRLLGETVAAAHSHAGSVSFDQPAWHLRQRGQRPPLDPSPPARLIEHRMDLGALRDDAHLAAWRASCSCSPHAWEILTLLWQGDSRTMAELTGRLARRGHPSGATKAAVAELAELGLASAVDGALAISGSGRRLRDRAEAQTDVYFSTPWTALDAGLDQRLSRLLRV